MAKESLKIYFFKSPTIHTHTHKIYIYIYSMATSQCLGQPITTRVYNMFPPNCYTNLNFHMHSFFIFLSTYLLTNYQSTYHLLTYLSVKNFLQNMNFVKLYFGYLKEFVQLTYEWNVFFFLILTNYFNW